MFKEYITDMVNGHLIESNKLNTESQNQSPVKNGWWVIRRHATKAFFESCGADIVAQDGGDHRMSDYGEEVRLVLEWFRTFN